MGKRMICISCPKGCELILEVNNEKLTSVKGNDCKRGEMFARSEVENPTRVVTSVVTIRKAKSKLLPVISAEPLPKQKIEEAIKEMRNIVVDAPVREGEIIKDDLAGTGIKLLAARSLKKIG